MKCWSVACNWWARRVGTHIMDSTSQSPFPIERSNLYLMWLAQREQINAHKWVMSERAGFDVGWDAARFSWEMNHRQAWVVGMRAKGLWPK